MPANDYGHYRRFTTTEWVGWETLSVFYVSDWAKAQCDSDVVSDYWWVTYV